MTNPTIIKIETLFDRCCKKIDDVGVPKVVSTVAYLVSTDPTKLIVKGMLYTMLMII
jgi:hypothetical protein